MTTDREVMQMALDALEQSRVFVTTREKIKHPEGTEWYDERIEALRARLAQPDSEPVAWMRVETFVDGDNSWSELNVIHRQDNGGTPLYTAPPEQSKQEPVAWMYDFPNPDDPTEIIKDWTAFSLDEVRRCGGVNVRPLYTAPPKREWQGLTGEEAAACWSTSAVETWKSFEAALKEKNR